jgi:hypothetical protein
MEQPYNVALDHHIEVVANGGASLILTVSNGDGLQWLGDSDDEPLVVEGLGAFEGIFAQLDLLDSVAMSEHKFGGGVRNWIWSGFGENVYAKGNEK